LDLASLTSHRFPEQRVRFTARDTILYALSVGAGSDPAREHDIGLVYEKDLKSLPTLATVLAHPGMWLTNPTFDASVAKLLHGEQRLEIARPLPAEGEIIAEHRIRAVVDKGRESGSLVYFEKRILDAQTRDPLCSSMQTFFLRGDGGCGNYGTPPAALLPAPTRAADLVDEMRTSASAALLYRLNGDWNPLHVDVSAARAAGFERPILHGLCVFGSVAYLLTRSLCDHDPRRIVSLAARFASPVFPGDTIRLEGCRDDDVLHFRVLVPERDQVALSHGVARIRRTAEPGE
jgi:acyl dehydratase